MADQSISADKAPVHTHCESRTQQVTHPAAFSTWLQAQQQAAIDGMRSTTGAEFAKHSTTFLDLITAFRVLWNFEGEVSHG